PFNDPQRQQASPDESRRAAHMADPDSLAAWIAAAGRLLRPGGTLTLIYRAEGLADVLAALARPFGAIAVTPVHPQPAARATRVLSGATAQSRAGLTVQPGLILAEADGRPSRAADAILRDAQPLGGG